jgi:dsDNA-binding SOS-regulon protein
VFSDGPGPFYKRFSINSASVKFEPKPWGRPPTLLYEERVERKKQQVVSKKNNDDVVKLIETAKLLGMSSWVDRQRERKSCLLKREKKALLDAKKKKRVDAAETPSSVVSDNAKPSISQLLKGARPASAKL